MSGNGLRGVGYGLVVLILSGTIGCTTCDDIKAEADALADDAAKCSAGDTCIPVYIGGSCIASIICASAVNEKTDLDQLHQRAQEISADYEDQGCSECMMADCPGLDEFTASCNTETGRCELTRI